MKIATFWASLFIALSALCHFANAREQVSLAFPDRKIGLPALSLADVGKENRPPIFKSEAPASAETRKEIPGVPTLGDDKFVIKPDTRVDYKLVIKQPDPAVNYRLIVKNPDTVGKK